MRTTSKKFSQKSDVQEENLLDIVFAINPDLIYSVNDDKIVTIEIPQNHPIQRFFRKLRVKIPQTQKIELDEIGSFVFLSIDGKCTVKEVGEQLHNAYGEEVEPLWKRLSQYLDIMEKKCHYIVRAS